MYPPPYDGDANMCVQKSVPKHCLGGQWQGTCCRIWGLSSRIWYHAGRAPQNVVRFGLYYFWIVLLNTTRLHIPDIGGGTLSSSYCKSTCWFISQQFTTNSCILQLWAQANIGKKNEDNVSLHKGTKVHMDSTLRYLLVLVLNASGNGNKQITIGTLKSKPSIQYI